MARIAGVNIPQNKVVHVALTYIHGIGKKFSNDICTKLNILKNKRTKEHIKLHIILPVLCSMDKKYTKSQSI